MNLFPSSPDFFPPHDDEDFSASQSSPQVEKTIQMLRAQIAPLVRPTNVPNAPLDKSAKFSAVPRDAVFRFERGQLLKVYRFLRQQREKTKGTHEKQMWHDLLNEFGAQARPLAKNLDILNRQVYTPFTSAHIEGHLIGEHTVPVMKLDLMPDMENDDRIPFVLLGTYCADTPHVAELSMALALRGEKVYTFPWPERENVQSPPDWRDRVEHARNFDLHAQYARKVIESLESEKVNIVGYSMGGGVALALASQQDFHRIHDLHVLEPVGIEKKGVPKLALQFAYQALHTLMSTEAKAKSFVSPKVEPFPVKPGLSGPIADLLAKECVTLWQLADVRCSGRYQVWLGENSPLTNARNTKFFLFADEKRPQGHLPIEIYILKGSHHGGPSIQTLGMMNRWEGASLSPVTEVLSDQLANSAALLILESLR